jgi:PAS domain S-box-containing protein
MDYRSLILVVDDQQRGRIALESLLEPEGYRLAFAASGPEALEQCVQLRPDLVLLDVMMPGMDGFEVCRRLRASPATAEVPVVMVTALDDHGSLLQGIEAGADDFVTKPFNRAELRTRVRTIARLNRYRGLYQGRERYAQLVEASPNGILIVAHDGTVRLANPALCALLGAEPESVVGRALLDAVAPDRRAALACGLADLAAGRVERLHLETILVSRGGLRRPVAVDGGRCPWDAEPATQLIVRDITDQKRAELLEVERRQVAYELHDGPAQLVTSLYQHLQAYARRHRPRSSAALAGLEQLQQLARRAVAEIRQVLEGLRPSAIDDFGLAGALALLVAALRDDGWDLAYEAQLDGAPLPPAVETALFRIAQEALTNVGKHAGARRAALRVARDAGAVRLSVRDWGAGFDPAARGAAGRGEQLGLRGMRDRAAILGGELHVRTAPGRGAEILAVIPLAGAELEEVGYGR